MTAVRTALPEAIRATEPRDSTSPRTILVAPERDRHLAPEFPERFRRGESMPDRLTALARGSHRDEGAPVNQVRLSLDKSEPRRPRDRPVETPRSLRPSGPRSLARARAPRGQARIVGDNATRGLFTDRPERLASGQGKLPSRDASASPNGRFHQKSGHSNQGFAAVGAFRRCLREPRGPAESAKRYREARRRETLYGRISVAR